MLRLPLYESVLPRYVKSVTFSSGSLPSMFTFMSSSVFTCINLVFFTLIMSPAFAPVAATSSVAFWGFSSVLSSRAISFANAKSDSFYSGYRELIFFL